MSAGIFLFFADENILQPMTAIQILTTQTEGAYQWTFRMLDNVATDKWDIMPPTIDSTLSWQVGHLLVSHYFHSIWVIRGHQMDILQSIPLKVYGELYTDAPPVGSIGKSTPEQLLNHLRIMQDKSLAIISQLTDADLESPLEPTPLKHPVAKTKFEAIDWNIKHTMYHCGQIGIIRRVVDQRFDFGLRV
ncbi:DinB family protein [Chryseolinea sp. T2]|uniref:DinB family protein n=1 Tax=Chryseolinea sp. T2 TaxID=3129255 RepID=UPI0030785265